MGRNQGRKTGKSMTERILTELLPLTGRIRERHSLSERIALHFDPWLDSILVNCDKAVNSPKVIKKR